MTKEEIVEHFDIEDPVIFFEPSEVFNKGILGISEDKHHLIYGYYTLAAALAEDYEKEWKGKEHKVDEEEPDFMSDAFEWLDYNTIRSLPYCDEDVCPILIYELPQE